MAYKVVSFEPTPNPNAVKCVLDRSPGPRPRSYFKAEQAAGDPIAEPLFALDGVTNVLVHDGWISVCKTADADWKRIKAGIERVLSGAE